MKGGAIGLTFNSKLTTKMCGSNLNTSPMANPIGYVHVALYNMHASAIFNVKHTIKLLQSFLQLSLDEVRKRDSLMICIEAKSNLALCSSFQ